MVISSNIMASSTKIWFSDFAYTIRLIMAKLLQSFLAEIFARIPAHPAGAWGWRIYDFTAMPWAFVGLRKIPAPMKAAVAQQAMSMMAAHRPGQFTLSI